MGEITFGGAFLAGLLSFLSPCVLPLVPPYLCFLAGTTLEELSGDETPPEAGRHVVFAAALFVLGFATVASDAATARMAARIGPMHGVQPNAKASPIA